MLRWAEIIDFWLAVDDGRSVGLSSDGVQIPNPNVILGLFANDGHIQCKNSNSVCFITFVVQLLV